MSLDTHFAEPPLLPSLQFNSDDYHPSDRLEAMNAFSHGLYEYAPYDGHLCREAPSDPMLRLKAWSLDGIAAAAFENSPVTAQSVRDRNAAFDDQIFLRVIQLGSVAAASDDAEAVLLPGSIHLMHANNRLQPSETGSVISLRFPYESVGYDPFRHPRFLSFSTDLWVGRTVDAAIQTLFESLPSMTTAEAKDVEPVITSLVRAMLSSRPLDDEAHAAVASARTSAMRRYIQAHLRDPGLDTQRLRDVFNTSRATIYRAFEDVGGVAKFVRDQRLHAIYRELVETPPERGAIRRVAEKYCFWDQSSFVRAFRTAFGARPGEIIGSQMRVDAQCVASNGRVALKGPTLASFWS